MKNFLIVVIIGFALFFWGAYSGVINIHYFRYIENQTLSHPVGIASVIGNRITLENGRTIELDDGPLAEHWNAILKKNRSQIEVEDLEVDMLIIWGNEPRFICSGTAPFRIPLIPRDVNRNRRSLIGGGHYVADGINAIPAGAK